MRAANWTTTSSACARRAPSAAPLGTLPHAATAASSVFEVRVLRFASLRCAAALAVSSACTPLPEAARASAPASVGETTSARLLSMWQCA
jgi:hypothetical protein